MPIAAAALQTGVHNIDAYAGRLLRTALPVLVICWVLGLQIELCMKDASYPPAVFAGQCISNSAQEPAMAASCNRLAPHRASTTYPLD